MTASILYTQPAHRYACQLIHDEQHVRRDAGSQRETSDRAVESMAPETVGTERERLDSLTNRCRLAAIAARTDERHRQWTDLGSVQP